MKKEITVSYLNRQGVRCDIPAVPKIILANKHLTSLSGFNVGDKAVVEYLPNSIIIKKIN